MSASDVSGVALITGAASGIGRGTTKAFANAGCKKILIGDVHLEGLQKTRATILNEHPDCDIDVSVVDISDEVAVQQFTDYCVSRFGRIDYACNIAGIVPPRTSIVETSVETFDRVVDVNAYGTFLSHRAQIRQLLTQPPSTSGHRGTIVSISSLAGLNASPGVSPYSSTKFAILAQVKTDALDYGPHGIRVCAVCPGFTDTEALHAMSTAEQRTKLAGTVPLRRLGEPEEVGRAVVWLCSEAAAYVHGTPVIVDGGATVWRQG